ncbi:MAG: isopentenyl-diphosphate Delta-isomerase [Luminiphilus sp.]|nr:isopentenyl-diphosphate Delta-isomerase [Gammaproteobacteria bacterium]
MDPSQTTKAAANGDVVSFDNEALIIVDAQDRILGHGTKAELHQGAGTLHRAFSIFLFDDAGHVLLQKRSADKPLWPGFWSNTCCSHPRRGESYGIATRRRLKEELGVEAPLRFTHRFRYQAQFSAEGAEHELCSVYVGRIDGDPVPNPQEVSDWQWVSPSALDEWLDTNPENLTPWFKLEWAALRSGEHAETLERIGLSWNPSQAQAG